AIGGRELLLRIERVPGHDLLEEFDIALKAARAPVEPAFARADFDAGHVLGGGRGYGRRKQKTGDPQNESESHKPAFRNGHPAVYVDAKYRHVACRIRSRLSCRPRRAFHAADVRSFQGRNQPVLKKSLIIATAVAPVVIVSAVAQQSGIKRTPLQT